MKSLSCLLLLFAVHSVFIPELIAETGLARIVVNKKMVVRWSSGSPFAEVSSGRLGSAGFVQLADYPSRTVFEGPANSAPSLLVSLRSEGYDARLASDLDELAFRGHRIDPDTGVATPPFSSDVYQPSGGRGMFILMLRSYPTRPWLSGLESRGVRLVESLSPAAYIVRMDRAKAATLKSEVDFVRGIFSITPGMKNPLGSSPSASPYRHVLVQAMDENASLKPWLDAYSEKPPVEADRSGDGKVSYSAWLSDVEISTLSFFDTVYSVAEFGVSAPSSERQGMLVLKPEVEAGTGRLKLPAPLIPDTNDYYHLLTHSGTDLSNFFNTRIGFLDTGFDDGSNTHPDFQFGGTPSVEQLLTEFGSTADDQGHGTYTASLITGFTNFDKVDADGYRFGLGIAPGVKLISDKYFQCGGGADLSTALGRIKPFSINLVNMSWNECGGSGAASTCGYTPSSLVVDGATRKGPWLFVISAGNIPDDNIPLTPCTGQCPFVRGPATAKNGLAVGGTENFTPVGWLNGSTTGTCAWNGSPAVADARHIPSFSAPRDPLSMVKPDLVAPSVRITGPNTRGTICTSTGSVYCTTEIASFPPGNPNGRYGMSAGTSFAAPAVTGAAAVVRRWFYNLTGVVPDPSPAMVKAILINGARDVGGPPSAPPCPAGAVRNQSFTQTACIGHIPDRYQGWGMLSLDRLLGPSNNYYFSDQDWHPPLSDSMPVWQAVLTINDPSRPVRATLVYSDASGNMEQVAPYRVKNDIDLRVYVDGYGHWWYGNNFDSSTGQSRLNIFASDPWNNVEQIIIPANTYPAGTQIRVCTVNINITESIWPDPLGNPVQDFAIFAENAR